VCSTYLRAAQLFPENGRTYNQLAQLTHLLNRYLDEWYYYARAIDAKNNFATATESLMQFTTQIRKITVGFDTVVRLCA
jgi:hypothetical protein